jgi:hypothetical protein
VGADFDSNDNCVILLSSGAAIVMNTTKGVPMPEAVIKPHVDLKLLGSPIVSPRSDESQRFAVAWGKQGGRRMFYMSDLLCPAPPTGDLRLSGSKPGVYCVFPDDSSASFPPQHADPEDGLHWHAWLQRWIPKLPLSSGAGSVNADALQQVRFLRQCRHVPLPNSNSRATVDNIIALAASEHFDLVAIATSNGHLQAASARKPPSSSALQRRFSRGSAVCDTVY